MKTALGIILAPTAWSVQHVVSSALAAQLCSDVAPSSVRITLVLIGCAALAACFIGGLLAFQVFRTNAGPQVSAMRVEVEPVMPFLGFFGLGVSACFMVGVLWNTLGPALVSACEVTR